MLLGVMFSVNPTTANAAGAVSAVFGGGPFVTGGQAVMDNLRASGFNTIVIWSIHVQTNGDLYINDIKVCSGGQYVGDAAWKAQWATLKQAPTSVNRIEVSVGAYGCADFENIRTLINANGTGSGTVLYQNFAALKAATGADAVDFDDESCYDVNSTVSFANMCSTMGYKVTLCPYTQTSFWSSVKSQLGSTVDRVYLQCYDGGAGNNPATWKSSLGMNVIPGLWCLHGGAGDSADTVYSKLSSWKSSSDGGFMWLYDDMQKLASPNSTADYANAINSAFNTPTATNIALNKNATANQYVTGETPAKAVDGTTANNSKWCSNVTGDKWLSLDLGQNYDISRWIVKHAGAGGESTAWNTKNFKLQKSSDGTNWVDVDTVSNNTASITDRTVPTFTARYVRLYITTPTQNTDPAARIYELELY